jgi:hypothetical protein
VAAEARNGNCEVRANGERELMPFALKNRGRLMSGRFFFCIKPKVVARQLLLSGHNTQNPFNERYGDVTTANPANRLNHGVISNTEPKVVRPSPVVIP